MKSRSGQILPLALVLIVSLALLWVTLLNVSKLIKDRIQMQVAADTAVQTACAYRARALNIIGVLNGWLGTPVIGIGTPQASWWFTPPHSLDQRVVKQTLDEFRAAAQEAQKYLSGDQKASYLDILAFLTRSLGMLIALSYDTHPPEDPNFAEKQRAFIQAVIQVQDHYLKTYGGGYAWLKAREVAQAQGADDIYIPKGSLSLGLIRNRGLIWYLGTLHLWYYKWPLPPLPFLPINLDDDITDRWYEQSRTTFYRKSMRLYAYRRPGSPFNGSFPMGQNVLKNEMPYLYTVAAARVYNPQGPMFPTSDETDGFLGGVAAQSDYNSAKNGWHTQLVPIGSLYEH